MRRFKLKGLLALWSLVTTSAFIVAPASAGTFDVTGTWGSYSGTGSSYTSLFTATNDDLQPRLELRSEASGQNYTLQATWTFTVTWTPSGTETAPPSANVQIGKSSVLTVAGNGFAQITSGATVLDSMDGSDNLLSGGITTLSDTTINVTLTAQPDGTYTGTGTITTDLLNANFNSSTSDITKCVEELLVVSITEGS